MKSATANHLEVKIGTPLRLSKKSRQNKNKHRSSKPGPRIVDELKVVIQEELQKAKSTPEADFVIAEIMSVYKGEQDEEKSSFTVEKTKE